MFHDDIQIKLFVVFSKLKGICLFIVHYGIINLLHSLNFSIIGFLIYFMDIASSSSSIVEPGILCKFIFIEHLC